MWPFNKKQIENRNYTDAHLAAALSNAQGGGNAVVSQCGGCEIAAGLWSRAFASASVQGDSIPKWLTSEVLGIIGRDLIVRGEVLGVVSGGEFIVASKYKLKGNVARSSWRYMLEVQTPDGKQYAFNNLQADKVAHFRYSVHPTKRWLGIGPLQRAAYSGKLLANIEKALSDECASPVGSLLPVPMAGDSDKLSGLVDTIKNLRGAVAMIETTAAGMGEGKLSAPARDWVPSRLGANPSAVLVNLYEVATREVLAVCGVPVELVSLADGTGQREAWRRFLWGSVAPISKRVEAELSRVNGTPLSLSFEELNASDITGRARAFSHLVCVI